LHEEARAVAEAWVEASGWEDGPPSSRETPAPQTDDARPGVARFDLERGWGRLERFVFFAALGGVGVSVALVVGLLSG